MWTIRRCLDVFCIEEGSKVRLSTGETARIVEVYGGGEAYEAEIDRPSEDFSITIDTIYPEDIVAIIKEIEISFSTLYKNDYVRLHTGERGRILKILKDDTFLTRVFEKDFQEIELKKSDIKSKIVEVDEPIQEWALA